MKKFFIILCFLPIYNACDSGGDAQLPPPGKVMTVPHLDDTSAVELGIDAVPDADAIILQWYDLGDPGVKYYDVYRQKTNETFFRRIRRIDLDTAFPGQDTVYTDNSADLQLNIKTFYFIIAVNRDNLEGAPSDTVYYTLVRKPETVRPNGELVQGKPVLYWSFLDVPPEKYIVRIEEEFTNRLVFVRRFKVTEYEPDQVLDLGTIDDPPQFIPNFVYRWRLDSIGPDSLYSGSESQWRIFTAQ